MPDHIFNLVLVNNSAPEQMPDVRRQTVDFALLSVQSKSKEFPLRNIEVLVEALLQLLRFTFQTCSQLGIIPHLSRQTRAADFRVVGITLNFTGGAGGGRQRAVGKQD